MAENFPTWGLLEWILALELLLVVIFAIMALIGSVLGRLKDKEDPVGIFINTFWKELLWPPTVMAFDTARATSKPLPPAQRDRGEASEEDEFYGRLPKGADGRVAATELPILVVANAASDAVVGRDGDGIRIQVTGEAGDSRSNKALIELVANAMGVKPYQVTLTKGHYQPRKTVQLQGVSPDELQAKLAGMNEAED